MLELKTGVALSIGQDKTEGRTCSLMLTHDKIRGMFIFVLHQLTTKVKKHQDKIVMVAKPSGKQ